MRPEEKTQLLALLNGKGAWCQEVEARDRNGLAVRCDDRAAVAWDLTGALCRLFGWRRACVLFPQLDRHIHGKRNVPAWPRRDEQLDALAALQDFNDRSATTFEKMRSIIETMPVWHGGGAPEASDGDS